MAPLALYLCAMATSELRQTELVKTLSTLARDQRVSLLSDGFDSLETIQGCLFLLEYAPLGVIPGEAVTGAQSKLRLSLGPLIIARRVAQSIGLPDAARDVITTDPGRAWESAIVCTWLHLCVAEDRMRLEDAASSSAPNHDSPLLEVQQVLDCLPLPAVDRVDPRSFAKLTLGERVTRSFIVQETISFLGDVLVSACTGQCDEPRADIRSIYQSARDKMEEAQSRSDALIGAYTRSSPISRPSV